MIRSNDKQAWNLLTIAYVLIDDIYQEVTPTHIINPCNINDSIQLNIERVIVKSYWGLLSRLSST